MKEDRQTSVRILRDKNEIKKLFYFMKYAILQEKGRITPNGSSNATGATTATRGPEGKGQKVRLLSLLFQRVGLPPMVKVGPNPRLLRE